MLKVGKCLIDELLIMPPLLKIYCNAPWMYKIALILHDSTVYTLEMQEIRNSAYKSALEKYCSEQCNSAL